MDENESVAEYFTAEIAEAAENDIAKREWIGQALRFIRDDRQDQTAQAPVPPLAI